MCKILVCTYIYVYVGFYCWCCRSFMLMHRARPFYTSRKTESISFFVRCFEHGNFDASLIWADFFLLLLLSLPFISTVFFAKKKYFCSARFNLPSTSHTTEIHYVHYFMRHNYGLRRCPTQLVLSNPFFCCCRRCFTPSFFRVAFRFFSKTLNAIVLIKPEYI